MFVFDKKLADLLNEESFIRWINGKASLDEEKYWKDWLQEDPLHRELKRKVEAMYKYPWEMDEANELEMQLGKLNERIGQNDGNTDLTLAPKVQKKSKHRKQQARNRIQLSVAAAILLLVSIVSAIILYNYDWQDEPVKSATIFKTLKVDKGNKGFLKISDGSSIQLNSGASLRYSPEQFSTRRVEVWLQGEGYFDIANNPNGLARKFIVHTPHGDVSVLGTKFNVFTHSQTTSVVLEQGWVKVALHDTLSNKRIEKIMTPGERAVMDKSSKNIELQKIDVNLFTSWLEEKMELSNTSLKQVVAVIEAKYSVSINAINPEVLEKRMTGMIQNPNLEVLLDGLEKMLEVRIEKKNEKEFLITKQSL